MPNSNRIKDNVATSRAMRKEMRKSAATVVGALDRASRGGYKSAASGRYITVSGKSRAVSSKSRTDR